MLFLFFPRAYSTWVRRSMLYTEFLQCLSLVRTFLFKLDFLSSWTFFFFFPQLCYQFVYPYLLVTSLLSYLAFNWLLTSFLLLLKPLFLFLHLQNFLLRTRIVFNVAENVCLYCHKEEQVTTRYFICQPLNSSQKEIDKDALARDWKDIWTKVFAPDLMLPCASVPGYHWDTGSDSPWSQPVSHFCMFTWAIFKLDQWIPQKWEGYGARTYTPLVLSDLF